MHDHGMAELGVMIILVIQWDTTVRMGLSKGLPLYLAKQAAVESCLCMALRIRLGLL